MKVEILLMLVYGVSVVCSAVYGLLYYSSNGIGSDAYKDENDAALTWMPVLNTISCIMWFTDFPLTKYNKYHKN